MFVDTHVYRYLLPWFQLYLDKLTPIFFSKTDGALADVSTAACLIELVETRSACVLPGIIEGEDSLRVQLIKVNKIGNVRTMMQRHGYLRTQLSPQPRNIP